MLNRILHRLEERPLSAWQICLVFLVFVLVRLQAEVLFLDPNRWADFFVFNIWYFFSLLLSSAQRLANGNTLLGANTGAAIAITALEWITYHRRITV